MTATAARDVRAAVLVCLTLFAVWAAPALATTPLGREGEADALRLLQRAADASRSVAYVGTQYVGSWSATASSSTLAEVSHDPAQGTVVTRPSNAGPGRDGTELVVPDGGPAALEAQVLDVLARHYALRIAGPAECAGRSADLVEARRTGVRGDGAVAGRFWLDRESGLVLRREVYDETGRAVRSSAFLDLAVLPATAGAAPSARQVDPGTTTALGDLPARVRERGWDAPEQLPGGFTLFDAQLRDGERRVHLTYSDGLSTLSVFAQRGELGEGPDGSFLRSTVDGTAVWTSDSVPQRVVWSGDGKVWTLVSDAPTTAVRAAVEALPHDPPPDDGLVARLARGLKRMGGMLNPFG